MEENLRRQLTAFANFTTRSVTEIDLDTLMFDACVRARAGVNVSHAKLLEYLPGLDRLVVRAGVGWREGVVGRYTVAPSIDTPIGYALSLGEPTIIPNYQDETRFSYPSLLREHQCVASANVPLRVESGIFGILEVDHTSAKHFTSDDIAFLTGLGNTVAQFVRLKRSMIAMSKALEDEQLIRREMNHRIKNNLSLVSAILGLQSKRFTDPAVREEFRSAANRIRTLALVHDRLQTFQGTRVRADEHFSELARLLESLLPSGVILRTSCIGEIPPDNLEPLTLITNELVTNAAKHAFVGMCSGEVIIGYQQEGAAWRMWVSDNGGGMRTDPNEKSFGTQMIEAMASRLNAELSYTKKFGTRVEVFYGGTQRAL